MESMVSIVNLVFKDVSARKILSGLINYEHFLKDEFISLYNQKSDSMSGNDVEQLYYYLLTLVEPPSQDEAKPTKVFEREGFSVLALVREYTNRVLEQIQGNPVCKYCRLFAWRMVTSKLDEDIFTTAFLAAQDIEKSWSKRTDFNWPTVIGHNNYELNNLLKKGVVENHYHLKGSAPYFALTWLNLMNDIENEKFIRCLQQFDDHRLTKGIYPTSDSYDLSYVEMHLQAALIRCFLFCKLTNRVFNIFDSYQMDIDEIEHYINWPKEDKVINCNDIFEALNYFEKAGLTKVGYKQFIRCIFRNTGAEKKIELFWTAILDCISSQHIFDIAFLREKIKGENFYLKELVMLFLGRMKILNIPEDKMKVLIRPEEQKRFVEKKEFANVYYYLTTPESIYEIRHELQTFINEIHIYKIPSSEDDIKQQELIYDYIDCGEADSEGEFQNINRTERWFLYRMFLKLYSKDPEYLAVGNMFYAYLVMKGRIRAELVQANSKTGFDNFLKYQDRKEYFIDDTRYERIYSYIALADTWYYQRNTMVGLEARISPKETAEDNRKAIAGQIKALEKVKAGQNKTFFVFHFIKEPDQELTSGKQQCRHHRKRVEIRKKAIAIERFRQDYPKEASYVYGIDACSPEIGCRPEVFAQAFTYLRGMQESANVHSEKVPRLGISYHVGEDFLDIVDGLRAIDEAIHFLQMDSGDRLGHALALGVNPKEWYEYKGSHVLMTKQDHLDNIVWTYMKIRKYDIRHSESILQELHRDYIHCYQEIYGIDNYCDINVYYDAWKLRGDDPEIYLEDSLEAADTEWDYFARNECYPENKKIRKQKLCRDLYIMYHYDDNVKKKGAEVVECKISRELMEVIEQIQKHLQREIARLGISIEANPSSNYMIGTFDRYDQHPLRNFYNKGLTGCYEELMENPQIDVTINTDDQAIFSTNLENEYAYIALSMEKLRNRNGEPIYKRSMIYEWLNNIRRNSIKVCFMQNVNRSDLWRSEEKIGERDQDYE